MRIALAFRLVLTLSAISFVALAQTESPDQTKPRIRSLSHAIHAVDDLDTTLAFYREVFGLNGLPLIERLAAAQGEDTPTISTDYLRVHEPAPSPPLDHKEHVTS